VTDRRRLETALDALAPVAVASCVLAAAAASSIQFDLQRTGMPARWGFIVLFLAFACVRASLCLSEWRFPAAAGAALLVFAGFALVSTTWSVHPRGTVERAVGQVVVVAAVALLAGCVPSKPSLRGRLLDGVLLAAAVVAFAGFVYWLAHPSRGAIAATVEYPSRYQGIEENPNTAALLLAIAMPLALARALRATGAATRALYWLLVAGFAASISASGSRGGLLGGFVGLLVVVALAPLAARARLGLAALAVAALAVSAWAMTIPKALPAAAPAARAAPARVSRNAETVLPLSQEIGNPWWTHRAGGYRRSLFNTSVRLRALRGTIRLALGRPLLGYGFGAEQWTFFNRYYSFSSGNPENGYVGILLQTGLVGLALFLLAVGLCVFPGVRACLRGPRVDLSLVAAVGATAAGLSMGLSQSFFHGPGGIAYVAFWTALLLTAAAGATQPRQ
jgi:hypothetical protein